MNVTKPDIVTLRRAIDGVHALAGFEPSGLAKAIESLQARKDEDAISALNTAIQQKDVPRLEFAIKQVQAKYQG